MTDHLRSVEIPAVFVSGTTAGGTIDGIKQDVITPDGEIPYAEGPIAYDISKSHNPDVYIVQTETGFEDKRIENKKHKKKNRLIGAKNELSEEIEQFLKTKKRKIAKPNPLKPHFKHSMSMPDLKKIEKLSNKSETNMFSTDLVRNFIKADIPLTKNSFHLCPHPHHCAQNAVFKGLLRTFAAAYMFKTTIALAGQLFGGRIISFKKKGFGVNWSKIESIYYNVDTIKFAQFVGLASFTFKALVCILRRWRLKDPIYHKTIAGFVAGLWVLRDTKDRRKTLALYCMVRMLGDWIKLVQYLIKNNNLSFKQLFAASNSSKNSTKTAKNTQKSLQTSHKNTHSTHSAHSTILNNSAEIPQQVSVVPGELRTQLQTQGTISKYLKYLKYIDGEVFTFTISQIVIMYGTMHASYAVDPSYYKWIKNMGQFNEWHLQSTMRSRIDKTAMYRLAGEKWLPCDQTWHVGTHSCLKHNVIDFFKCIIRAGRMYLPVHFLPMLLFTPKIVFNSPITFLKLKSLNTLRSAVFLAFYVFNVKHTICVLRNLFKSDDMWISMVGGFMAGLSIMAEHSKRRIELCLYVIPRTIEILFRLIPDKKYYKHGYKLLRSKYLPVVSFAVAMSGWMTLIAVRNGTKCANGLNMTVLRVVFGSMN